MIKRSKIKNNQHAPASCSKSIVYSLLSNAGFSLIELMLTVSFIMLGAILLQGSYMRSAEIFGRYTHSLKSMVWMEEQIALAKEALLYSSDYVPLESGTLMDTGKAIQWSREIRSADTSNLYNVEMTMKWKEGGRPVEMEGEQYVYKRPATANL